MEALIIGLNLLRFALAAVALCFCVCLYRRRHRVGWLLIGAMFLEPFATVVIRAWRGRPLLNYQEMSAGADGAMQISYRVEFPVLMLAATLGLFLMLRAKRDTGPFETSN